MRGIMSKINAGDNRDMTIDHRAAKFDPFT